MAKKPETDVAAQQKRERDLERRRFVEIAAGAGMPPEEISLLLVPPVTVEQLQAEFSLELEMGPAKVNLEMTTGLLAAARKGNVTAMIYWTKSRMGWTERANAPSEKLPPSESAPAAAVPPTAGLFTGKLELVKK